MIQAYNNFNQNFSQVKQYGALYDLIVQHLPVLTTQADSLLRAEWVMAVSSLDTYIHDIVRIGIMQIYHGLRSSCNGCDTYPLSFKTLKQIESFTSSTDKDDALEAEIRKINEKDSYQSPKSIEYAMSLVGVTNIWTRVSPAMGLSANDVKLQLGLIVRRRNKIAHESDFDHLSAAQINITKNDVDDVVIFIENLVNAINSLL